MSKITNSALSDIQWLQASMPIAHGGLGVRRVSSLAILAFLVSAASTLPLQDDILSLCPCPTDTFLDQYLSIWSSVVHHLILCQENSHSGTFDCPDLFINTIQKRVMRNYL